MTSPTDAWVRGSSTCASLLGAVVLGREAEALEAGAVPARLAEIGVELDHADRLALVDEVGVGHAAQLVVAPPERLVLAPVPAEQLGQQPGRPLLVGRRRGGEVDALEIARQRGHHLGDLGGAPLGLGRLGGLGLQGRARDLHAEPLPEVEPPGLEPVAEEPRAHDVVAVVALDAAEDLVADEALGGGAAAEPGLELDDAAPGILQGDLAGEAVEGLEALDRVALDAGADPLPDDAVEVDEDAAAEQPVDLLLAGRVALGEAREGGLLVRGVVVDVEGGIRVEPGDEEVHQALEGSLLGGEGDEPLGVAAPEGDEPWDGGRGAGRRAAADPPAPAAAHRGSSSAVEGSSTPKR